PLWLKPLFVQALPSGLLRSAGRGEQDPLIDEAIQAGSDELCYSGLFLRHLGPASHFDGHARGPVNHQDHSSRRSFEECPNRQICRRGHRQCGHKGAVLPYKFCPRAGSVQRAPHGVPIVWAALDSARHRWAECPGYADVRLQLSVTCGISEEWWTAQPRCAARSRWITCTAAATVEKRANLQGAACKMGMAIIEMSG
ncbi:unnamed protein product, partial [Polarella glacialis]